MASFVRLVTCSALVMLGLASCDGGRTPAKRAVQCSVTDGVTIAASGVEMLPGASPLRWVSRRDGHAYESAGDPMRPLDLGPAQALGGSHWDDAFWYHFICFNDCHNADGAMYGVERIDKRTAAKVRLGTGDYGASVMTLVGDYVYWGNWGHNVDDGGVERVPRRGGPQERIRIWKKRDDYIQSLIPYPGRGILVIGLSSVAWIPGTEDEGIVLFKHMRIGDAVADDQYVFIAAESRGPVIVEQSGYIVRVSLATGEVERLTGMLDAPARIAVHGDRVYFMLDEDPDVWSVPKTGGEVTKVVSGPPYHPEQGEESLGLWAEECGLVWLHGNSADPATLQFMPWK